MALNRVLEGFPIWTDLSHDVQDQVHNGIFRFDVLDLSHDVQDQVHQLNNDSLPHCRPHRFDSIAAELA